MVEFAFSGDATLADAKAEFARAEDEVAMWGILRDTLRETLRAAEQELQAALTARSHAHRVMCSIEKRGNPPEK